MIPKMLLMIFCNSSILKVQHLFHVLQILFIRLPVCVTVYVLLYNNKCTLILLLISIWIYGQKQMLLIFVFDLTTF